MRRRSCLRDAFLYLLCLGLAACRVGQNPRPAVTDADSAASIAIRATMDAYTAALRDGNVRDLGTFFTNDAVLSEPDQPDIQGVRAIHHALQAFFEAGGNVVQVEVSPALLHVAGTSAFEFGEYVERWQMGDGGEETVHGRYAIQWRRGAEARWRIQRFLLNHMPAPASDDPEGGTSPGITPPPRDP